MTKEQLGIRREKGGQWTKNRAKEDTAKKNSGSASSGDRQRLAKGV